MVNLVESILIAGAGFGAGAVNTIVGSGSLITYPVLLAVGCPPLAANVANTVGLTAGSVSGAIGYRGELPPRGNGLVRLVATSAFGGLLGAALLLVLPASVFEAVVPILILFAACLVAAQPWLVRRISGLATSRSRAPLTIGVFMASVYGGYFSAAQGVILLGLLGLFVSWNIQRLNALKNVLQAVVNFVAACVFVVTADPRWPIVGLLTGGSVLGAQMGAMLGRRIPAALLRVVVVAVGLTVGVVMLM